MLNEVIKLRRDLHKNPELSQNELNTAKRIQSFIEPHHPSEIIPNIGGHGLAVCYNYAPNGPTIAIRCELDALPIEEENQFDYKSIVNGISHKCGHDGHMAIVAGLSLWLKEQKFERGKIILLFQPAEEIGKGAYDMLQDERLSQLKIDYMFALHNIPGEKMHRIITMQKGFSAEVQSFAVQFKGKESHAAEPENGINPAISISEIIAKLSRLNLPDPKDSKFSVLTPVYINMGEKSYGISPANGEIHYTIRTWNTKNMLTLKSKITQLIEEICTAHQLAFQIEWFEHFPAAENNEACNTIIKKAALKNKFKLIQKPHPFKFGEDFGWFSKAYKTGMFGLGAGTKTPALHSENYDFPDELIPTGIKMFEEIISEIIQNSMCSPILNFE